MAKAELQSLKQLQQAASQQQQISNPEAEHLSGAFGRGFLRSEELREALQVQEFVNEYKEKQRDQDREQRFKEAYKKRILSEKQEAEKNQREKMATKAKVDSINSRRLAEIRAKARKRAVDVRRDFVYGAEADSVVMQRVTGRFMI